ncbi:hypothetical protein L9F63_010423, partial [Diploptera punctata]
DELTHLFFFFILNYLLKPSEEDFLSFSLITIHLAILKESLERWELVYCPAIHFDNLVFTCYEKVLQELNKITNSVRINRAVHQLILLDK